jgi:hypothetical protein
MKKIEAKRAPGANPDTSAFEPEQIKVFSRKLSVWNIEDSEVGPGEIKAMVETNEADPLVDLTLKWISGNEQPEVWQIEWSHIPGYLMRELPEYLLRFCPVANEMIEMLGELGLEDLPTLEEWDEINEELDRRG